MKSIKSPTCPNTDILIRWQETFGTFWVPIRDGDPQAAMLYRRHYSCHTYRDGRRDNPLYRNRHLIVGPGERIILVTIDYSALFVWRKFLDKSGEQGINNAVFRNESDIQSSVLIRDAESFAWSRWPGERLYTYVNPRAIRSSNPGYCFLVAGWRRCGLTKKGLHILEKRPILQDHSDGTHLSATTQPDNNG